MRQKKVLNILKIKYKQQEDSGKMLDKDLNTKQLTFNLQDLLSGKLPQQSSPDKSQDKFYT